MRTTRNNVFVIGALTASLVAMPGVSSAHFLGADSVDGGFIHYIEASKWDQSRFWAEARWEELPGNVQIDPRPWNAVTDLEILDYSARDGYCGYWRSLVGPDAMRLNDSFYNGATETDRRNCTVHEFGHAQGLAHSMPDQAMDGCPVESCGRSYDRPQYHDKSDHDFLW